MRMLRACLVGSVVLLGACAGGSDGSSIQSSASGETPSDMPMNDAETRDQWLDINGVRVRYTVDGEGPVIILLHGYMVDAEMNWRSRGIIDSLAVDFTVIAPDLRGHGFSDNGVVERWNRTLKDPAGSAYGRRTLQPVLAPREAGVSHAKRSARGIRATPCRVAQTCVQETGCGTWVRVQAGVTAPSVR